MDEVPLKKQEEQLAGESYPQPAEEKKIKLSQPTRELAIKLLDKVSFGDRFTWYMASPGKLGGQLETQLVTFSNLGEAVDFLELCQDYYNRGDYLYERNLTDVKYINLEFLGNWIGKTLGDQELADAIKAELLKDSCNTHNLKDVIRYCSHLVPPIKGLIQKRLKQCREVASQKTSLDSD